MPGMMDTILNLGLNKSVAEALAERAGDARFAFDSYRRLVQMFGSVVLRVPNDGAIGISRFSYLQARAARPTGLS